MTDMSILQLGNISKSFGALKVADGVTFELAEGEALGVIGPNGAGKSTLFNLITGNTSPDDGTVIFAGADVTRASPMARCLAGVGRTFQIPQPFEKLTVFENLLVAAAFVSRKREAEVAARCADILVETGLANRANQPAGGLALLQRKRLELARALATEPRVLLLDEIAGGLNQHECEDLVALVARVNASGVTILWIEHVLHALLSVVTRALVLYQGGFIADGDPHEVLKQPKVAEIYMGIEADA
jgi:branched-chain amino acid transport system ATP-binding protein